MLFDFLRRRGDPYALVVGMTGVKMGDRVAQLGCAHGGRLAAIAKPVGLSGYAVAIVPDEASLSRAQQGAAQGGVLAEIQQAPLTHVPLADEAFDLVVIDDTDGMVGTHSETDRTLVVREALRVLRPGGRVMVIGSGPVSGIARLFRAGGGFTFDVASTLQTGGFKSVRTLAEREGLTFVEGLKASGHSVPTGAQSEDSQRA
jgi:ubiquinone/menaquinone biosynthesis C-methylase UbiE